jgi:hypothetical protein
MAKSTPVSIHRQTIRASTRFKRLPVLISNADIRAYYKLSRTDAQALMDSAHHHYLIEGVPKISKYHLQSDFYADMISVMQRHPSGPGINRAARAAVEKILADPTHPQHALFQKEFAKYAGTR